MPVGRPKGLPKTGGRKKGSPNKATADVKALAGVYGASAIEKLAYLMEKGESEQVQRAAASDLLDRAYGKPAQVIAGDEDAPLTFIERRIVRVND